MVFKIPKRPGDNKTLGGSPSGLGQGPATGGATSKPGGAASGKTLGGSPSGLGAGPATSGPSGGGGSNVSAGGGFGMGSGSGMGQGPGAPPPAAGATQTLTNSMSATGMPTATPQAGYNPGAGPSAQGAQMMAGAQQMPGAQGAAGMTGNVSTPGTDDFMTHEVAEPPSAFDDIMAKHEGRLEDDLAAVNARAAGENRRAAEWGAGMGASVGGGTMASGMAQAGLKGQQMELDARREHAQQGMELRMTHLQQQWREAEAKKDRDQMTKLQQMMDETRLQIEANRMGQDPAAFQGAGEGGGGGFTDDAKGALSNQWGGSTAGKIGLIGDAIGGGGTGTASAKAFDKVKGWMGF